jgi:alpha-amylase
MFIRPAVVASLFACISASSASTEEQSGRPWNHEIVYSVLLDRFFDGDPANNVPAGSDPELYDKTQQDINKYHGGDLRGLETAIQRGYFKDLGVTALAISSPVKNVWFSKGEGESAKTGYAGDWPQDFLDIDPHWTSAKSADGNTEYADSRDGRLQHYKDFVVLAHSNGLRVIQDVVLNHAGPVFFYDVNGNGQFDVDSREEWTPPFKDDGGYDNAVWADLPKWNAVKPAPGEPVTVLGRELKINGVLAQLETYGRRGYAEEALARDEEGKQCDVFSRRDLNTNPDSPHFKKLVDDFVEIHAFYVEEIGVDGLRMHLLKQTHRAFWDAFTAGLRERIGPDRTKELILIGHVNDTVPNEVGKYTYRKDREQKDDPTFDTVVNTPLILAAREYLRQVVGPYGKASAVEKAWSSLLGRGDDGSKLNTNAGADGLTALQKIVNQIEGADGYNRFRVSTVSEKQNILANALAIFSRGIPVLYYGTEANLIDAKGKIGKDGETGRLTLVPAGLHENLDLIRKTSSFQSLAALNAIRNKFSPLQDGVCAQLWSDSSSSDTDDGVFGFVRYIRPSEEDARPDFVIVVINASERPRATSAGAERMKLVLRSGKPLLNEGQKLVRLPVAGLDGTNVREQTINVFWYNGKPQVELLLAPQTVNIYQLAK